MGGRGDLSEPPEPPLDLLQKVNSTACLFADVSLMYFKISSTALQRGLDRLQQLEEVGRCHLSPTIAKLSE